MPTTLRHPQHRCQSSSSQVWAVRRRLDDSCELTSPQEQGGHSLPGRDSQNWWGEDCRHWLKPKPGPGAVGQCCSPGSCLPTPGLHWGSCSRDNLISLQISIGAAIARICVCLGAEPGPGRSSLCNKSSLGYFTALGSSAASPRLFKTLPKKALHLLLLLLLLSC